MGFWAFLASPAGQAIAGTALSAVNKALLSGQKGFDPSRYQDQITLSPQTERGLRRMARRSISEQSTGALGSLKQYASANRLPAGAVASGIRGITGEASKAAGDIDVKIEEQKHNQMMNYLGLLQGYENRMADQRMAGLDFTQEIGMLTRAMMLYRSGMLGDQNQRTTASK